jgi:hypothetical protein
MLRTQKDMRWTKGREAPPLILTSERAWRFGHDGEFLKRYKELQRRNVAIVTTDTIGTTFI